MRFSLKTMLIGFLFAGVLFGWMGKLWVEDPESFFSVLTIGTTAGPFVLAVGTIIWLGCRGRRSSSELLAAWGLLLLLTPVLGAGARTLLLPTGQPIRVLSTKRLIEKRLPNQIESPWTWNELEYRVSQGNLSKQQVNDAVRKLIAHMKKKKPQGWNQPLPWQSTFLGIVQQKKLISDEVLLEFCEAFFGLQPRFSVQSGRGDLSLNVEYGNPWQDNANFGVKLLWHVSAVSIDGNPQPLQREDKSFGRTWSAYCLTDLAAGDHELVIEVECAFIDAAKLLGLDHNTLTPDQWPRAMKRWKTQLKSTLQAEPISANGPSSVKE